ncbi:MAG: 3-hydroxyisobutyrate dehydrogenase [Gammaproteobacteria bacterium RIFCSPHIGHO2_12_FULL_38_11]|nr:MAG: 3-hydroxyisobutyrate dehydrogenase [Gammaproteobacteria bacterium RIFCSPHIGHO2_12_FULL_38_11]
MLTIGFIGLGNMGSPMVKNLLKNNYTVKVYDISKNAIANCVSVGAHASESLIDIAKESDVIITMLQTGDQVKQCCTGKQGIFAHLKSNALFIDCSSIDIQSSRALHHDAKSRHIAMVDAPVSGGVAGAENATLTFMVGGEENNFKRAEKILSAMGKKIIYAGGNGNGVAAKICNNMILGISMIAVSEAFVLAEKLGLDAKKLFEISSNASGQCWSLTHYCPWPNILPNVPSSNHYQPGFTAKMMLKDLHLSQDAAITTHANTPLAKHAMDLYQQFVESNTAEIDFSGIINLLLRAEC